MGQKKARANAAHLPPVDNQSTVSSMGFVGVIHLLTIINPKYSFLCVERWFNKITVHLQYSLIEKDYLGDRSPSQDSYHPDDLFQSRYATPGFKPFSYSQYCLC